MRLPKVNFMIVGVQKSGTTALSEFCSEHPEICMAKPKEPHLFDAEEFDEAGLDDNYSKFFDHFKGEAILGEATPIYMFLPEIAKRLHTYNPDLKLLVILRDPVDRAISQYSMSQSRGPGR